LIFDFLNLRAEKYFCTITDIVFQPSDIALKIEKSNLQKEISILVLGSAISSLKIALSLTISLTSSDIEIYTDIYADSACASCAHNIAAASLIIFGVDGKPGPAWLIQRHGSGPASGAAA
jgi:hypothetical protein